MKRVRIHVSGIVQGVNFRYFAQRRARSLGLTGWVRNCSDGSLEAVAEGPTDRIDEFVSWMRSGPSSARVDHVEVESQSADEPVSRFDIR